MADPELRKDLEDPHKDVDDSAIATRHDGSDDEAGDFSSIDPHSGVKRGLKTRHLSMMALAGIIGPGLLVGSGGALANGGPASLLIGFGVIGIIAFRYGFPCIRSTP